jgi:hypothetical protein
VVFTDRDLLPATVIPLVGLGGHGGLGAGVTAGIDAGDDDHFAPASSIVG